MARVNTNNTSLRFATESTLGTKPTAGWRLAEYNSINAYGATITTVARRPISQDRGRKKGAVTDLESAVEFETDLTVDAFTDFAEGFVFAEFANKEFDLKASSGTVPPPVGATNAYTIDSASALLGQKIQYSASYYASLVYAKGYTNSENNGLKPVAADTAPTDTAVTVAAASLVTETPPTNASLQVAGMRFITSATDYITLTISGGSTATLVITDSGTNYPADFWSSMGLRAGMFIHIGGVNTATGAVTNALDASGTLSYGYARITAVSGDTLSLDKLSTTLVTGADSTSNDCDILFGRFLRNVPVTANTNDNEYLERSYSMEVSYPDLGGSGTDEYEYAVGNYIGEMTLNLPLTEKATLGYAFTGTNTEDITQTRVTGPSGAVSPLRTTAFNTSSDIASITTDVVSSSSDVCFKSLTFTVSNNVSQEKCLGTLGASFINTGLFEVNLDGQMLFTNKAIVNAVKNNTTVTFMSILKNEDGAIALDIPEMTLSGGNRDFPVDESVLVNITGNSFTSATYGHDLGISVFPVAPWA